MLGLDGILESGPVRDDAELMRAVLLAMDSVARVHEQNTKLVQIIADHERRTKWLEMEVSRLKALREPPPRRKIIDPRFEHLGIAMAGGKAA